MTQGYSYLAEEFPAEAMEETAMALPRKRRIYSIFAIATSFLILWIAPVFGGDAAMGYAMVGALVICIWDAPASLFLLIASAGAYYSSPEAGASKITPTQIVALGLMLRCLISPGISGMGLFLRGMNKWVLAMLGIFLVGIVGTAVMQMYLLTLFQIITALIVFLVVGSLAVQIRDPKWVVISVAAGLFLSAAYYVLVWTHLLEAVAEISVFKSGGEFRVSGGRNDPNYVGTLISPCFAVLVLLFLAGKGRLRMFLIIAAAGLCFLANIDGGSRAGVGTMVLGGAMAMYFGIRSRHVSAVGRSILLLILGVIFAAATFTFYEARLQTMMERTQTIGADRSEWGLAVDHIIRHPIPDPLAFSWVSSTAAHQTFLSAGIEGGVLAMFGLAGMAIICIVTSWRQVKYLPAQDRIWQQAIVMIMFVTVLGVSFISVMADKVLWGMFAISGLSVRALGLEERQELPLDEGPQD